MNITIGQMNVVNHAKILASSLIDRMAWESQCKLIFKANSIKTGLGADATKLKLYNEFETNEVYAEKFIRLMDPYYFELMFSGDRTFRIFKLDADKINKIVDICSKLKFEDSVAKDYFPYTVPSEHLNSLGNDTKLTSVEERDGKLYMFFSTKRAITERYNYRPDELGEPPEVIKFFNKYSMVTVSTDKPRQYVDVICINPEDSTIELRLDTAFAVAFKDIDKLFIELQNAFFESCGSDKFDFSVFVNRLNFFPYIDLLYKDFDCRVCELNFTSADGYIHAERDRNKARGGDVRIGEFHKGGIVNCDISPYKISVRWSSNFAPEQRYEYELSLNSTHRELSKAGDGVLDYAVVSMCPRVDDMNKILSILKQNYELSKAS